MSAATMALAAGSTGSGTTWPEAFAIVGIFLAFALGIRWMR